MNITEAKFKVLMGIAGAEEPEGKYMSHKDFENQIAQDVVMGWRLHGPTSFTTYEDKDYMYQALTYLVVEQPQQQPMIQPAIMVPNRQQRRRR